MYIEDSFQGMKAAEKAGMTCYLFAPEKKWEGDFIPFYHMSELIPLIHLAKENNTL